MSLYIQVLHQQTRGGGGLEKTKEHQTLFFCFGMFRSARLDVVIRKIDLTLNALVVLMIML